MRTIHCMFSGGRDSALACYIAKRVASIRGWGFKLIHIDTGTALPGVREYVNEYAKWLNTELIILHAKIDYWEGVRKWGYPALWHNRWCMTYLKRIPFIEYAEGNVRSRDIVVMGIRRSESRFRLENFNRVIYRYCYRQYGVCLNLWLPLLYVDDYKLGELVRRFGIPVNPIWRRIGISGECMCMAGMTKKALIKVIVNYPGYARMLVERDKMVQEYRRDGRPGYPGPLYRDRITLHEFINRVLNNSLMNYIPSGDEYESCQSCLLA